MEEQDNSKALKKHTQKIAGLSISTRKQEVKKNFLDITALIRSIQRAEGNPDCFRKGQGHCDQVDCAWRSYCLENNQTPNGGETSLGQNSYLNRSF